MSETDGYTTDGGTSYTASTRGFPQPRRVTRQQRLDAKRRETFTRERARPRTARVYRETKARPWDRTTYCRPLHETCVDEEQKRWLRPRPLTVHMKDDASAGGSTTGASTMGASTAGASTATSATGRPKSARPVRPRSAPPAPFRARATYANLSRRNGMVDAAPGALPSRREGLAAFRPTTGGVVYARRLPVRPVTAGSVASGATSMTRRLGRRRRGWNKSSLVPRGDEAQRRSHPGLVDGGYQLKIVKHAPARRTSVDEIVFGHDLDGDGCCDDLEAAGVGLCAAGRSLF